ncbi:DMP19 family protein [Tropicibacter sp. S64]|uniref:DMP19 family protein n=1 Tax=Tropicibacter sp. S64 TaxID=3415122 RepID=UPI003C7E874C
MLSKLKHLLSGRAATDAFKRRKPGGGHRMGAVDTAAEPPRPPKGQTPPRDLPIIVPQSAMDALPDPAPLVQAVVNYVNHMQSKGRYKRGELPEAALQAFHTDFYLAQVNNGGHAQFVHNAFSIIDLTLDDVTKGLKAMGAQDYLILARAAQKWVQENPEEAKQQTGFTGGIAPALKRLDRPFYQLDRKTPLQGFIASWIAAHPALQVVPDAELGAELQKLADANPEGKRRDAIMVCANITASLQNALLMGAGMACGRVVPQDFIHQMGNGSYMDVEGEQKMAFFLRTLGGPHWLVPEEGKGVTLYACITHDNSHLPKDPLKASMDDIMKFRAPEVGAKLAFVSQADLLEAMRLSEDLKAGPALHMLGLRVGLSQLPRLTVLHSGSKVNGSPTVAFGFVHQRTAWLVSIDPTGAELVRTGDKGETMAKVTRAEIDFHAETHSLDSLR